MKTENTRDARTPAKTKVKIKSLRLSKETVASLTDQNAEAVRGGGYTYTCGAGCGGSIKK
jgi:hypothetical protein